MLWEHASRAMTDRPSEPRAVVLANGRSVSIETRPVSDGSAVIGAVLKLKETGAPSAPSRERTRESPPNLPGLVGRSPRWAQLCADACRVAPAERVLLVGEPGSGRRAVAAALVTSGPVRVVDAGDVAVHGLERWLQDVEAEVDGPEETLVLAHLDLLEPRQAQATERALRRRPSRRRVLGTSELGPHAAAGSNPLLDAFAVVLEVPPLRDRLEDLPPLVAALSKRAAPDGPMVRWMPDAIQVLSRLDWPGNLASLESLVRGMVSRCRNGYVGASDLPADVLAQSSRRPLAMLEHAEARAIMQALRDAGGNKHRAAASLGIARSTLYRKVRVLGLDLSTTTS